jgi:hypothetical protein
MASGIYWLTMFNNSNLHILYLYNLPDKNAQADNVFEYIQAFKKYSVHHIFEINMLGSFPEKIDLTRFDVIAVHYTLSLGPLIEHYFGRAFLAQLKAFKGKKIAFMQDEYRNIYNYHHSLNEYGFDLLFSIIPQGLIKKIYPKDKVPKLKTVNVLTGYVPYSWDADAFYRPLEERSIDVGYRSRKQPYWLGKLGQEKTLIMEGFQKHAKGLGLRLDLSTSEGSRLYGDDWKHFLSSCRTILGVESGASIVDFDGQLELDVSHYMKLHPKASFEEVHDKFMSKIEGNVNIAQISPRCFEAALLKVPMILFKGHYSGILKKGYHYISLEKDFSNFDEIVDLIKDDEYLKEIANNAYLDLVSNPEYQYAQFIRYVEQEISRLFVALDIDRAHQPYHSASFSHDFKHSYRFRVKRRVALTLNQFVIGNRHIRTMLFGLWSILPPEAQRLVRPLTKLISK